MNKLIRVLSFILWVTLPFVFIGSAYLVIPEFERIFEDMYEGIPLPLLTQLIVGAPLLFWPLIALLFATFNCYISTQKKNGILAATSIMAMLITSGTIVIGLFLPVTGRIYRVVDDPPVGSEPGGAVQPDNPPVKP